MQRNRHHSSATGEPVIYVDRTLWLQLAEATTAAAFCRAWLPLQCSLIPGASRAVVVYGEADTGPFAPVAHWPEGLGPSSVLTETAEHALSERQAQMRRREGGEYSVAYPLLVEGRLHGVVALDTSAETEAEAREIARQLQWGAAWLEAWTRRERAGAEDDIHRRMMTILHVIGVTMEHHTFREAAIVLATELAAELDCERVSIGVRRRGQTSVVGLSHSSTFTEKSNLMRTIGAAMDEAIDQHAEMVYPPTDAAPTHVMRDHRALSQCSENGSILTVPLYDGGEPWGAILLERPADSPFDAQISKIIGTTLAVLGPMLALQQYADRPLHEKVFHQLNRQAGRILGAEHPGRKLVVGASLVLAVFLFTADGAYRISADSLLEGAVRRTVTAPMDGYIVDAPVRAGDIVQETALLCALDDRDLRLERLKKSTEGAQLQAQLQEAMAKRERAQVQVIKAQIAQIDAQIALLDEQIARTRLLSPFEGVVTAGDLSQALGAAVQRGQKLFEIAPLAAYRILLQVDETEIAWVEVGQQGKLILTSLPGETLGFTVTAITPVATTEEGVNYFRVEAELEQSSERLRPGMEGVGKIDAGQRRLIWIYTHKLIEWLKLWTWSWWP